MDVVSKFWRTLYTSVGLVSQSGDTGLTLVHTPIRLVALIE